MWKSFAQALATEVGSLFNDADSEFVGRTVTIRGKSVRIIRLLGEGGFAYVYLGELDNGQKVALKRFITQTKEMLDSVIEEIRVMELLGNSCQNIVGYYGSERSKITEYKTEVLILMELCNGGSLTHYLQRSQNLSEDQVIRMFRQIVTAVAHMHKQRPPVAHRDLKIDNILIAKDGTFKLCDFGSCSTVDRTYTTKREIVQEQSIIDRTTTPSYRAPEIVDLYQRIRVNHKVDIWALGVILYAMAYNKMPFGQDCAKAAILEGNVKIPKSTRQPKRMGKLVKALLNKRPDRRPSCEEILAHCESLLTGGEGTIKFKRSKGKTRAAGLSIPKPIETHSSPSASPEPNDTVSFSEQKSKQKGDDFNEWDPFSSNKPESTEHKRSGQFSFGAVQSTTPSFGDFEAPTSNEKIENFDDHSWVSGSWLGFDSPEKKSNQTNGNQNPVCNFLQPNQLDVMSFQEANDKNTQKSSKSNGLLLPNNNSRHRHSKSADFVRDSSEKQKKKVQRSTRNASLDDHSGSKLGKFQFDPLGAMGVALPQEQPVAIVSPVESFDPLN